MNASALSRHCLRPDKGVLEDRGNFRMRVTIERTSFLKAFTHVQSVVERRNTIPILSNVLIQAASGKYA